MADDYLSDREQEEALRNWWRENWSWIIGGVVLGVALLLGWRFYQNYRAERSADAANLYEDVRAAAAKQDVVQANAALAALTSSHDETAYAQQARLLVAKLHADAGEWDEAAKSLQASIDKGEDEAMMQIARLRLARVLLQQDKFDEALQLLNTEKAGAFAAQVREARGDALLAKGDNEGARAEYAAALADNADMQTDRSLLEMKLQEVGGTSAAAETPTLTPAP